MMPQIPQYKNARNVMFATQPPTFVYGNCAQDVFDPSSLPLDSAKKYVRLQTSKGPTCLFILKSKVPAITNTQWENVKKYDIQRIPLDEKNIQ